MSSGESCRTGWRGRRSESHPRVCRGLRLGVDESRVRISWGWCDPQTCALATTMVALRWKYRATSGVVMPSGGRQRGVCGPVQEKGHCGRPKPRATVLSGTGSASSTETFVLLQRLGVTCLLLRSCCPLSSFHSLELDPRAPSNPFTTPKRPGFCETVPRPPSSRRLGSAPSPRSEGTLSPRSPLSFPHRCSSFWPCSSHGTHQLTTPTLQHTTNCIYRQSG